MKLDEAEIDAVMQAAQRSGMHTYALQQIAEVLRLVRVEANLRGSIPDQLARVDAAAKEAFGDEETAWHWLRTPNRLLVAAPLDLLHTRDGRKLVTQTLGRIAHGVFE